MCRYVFKHLYGDLTTHTVCTVVIVVSRKSEPGSCFLFLLFLGHGSGVLQSERASSISSEFIHPFTLIRKSYLNHINSSAQKEVGVQSKTLSSTSSGKGKPIWRVVGFVVSCRVRYTLNVSLEIARAAIASDSVCFYPWPST
jgi:hypothetical protein